MVDSNMIDYLEENEIETDWVDDLVKVEQPEASVLLQVLEDLGYVGEELDELIEKTTNRRLAARFNVGERAKIKTPVRGMSEGVIVSKGSRGVTLRFTDDTPLVDGCVRHASYDELAHAEEEHAGRWTTAALTAETLRRLVVGALRDGGVDVPDDCEWTRLLYLVEREASQHRAAAHHARQAQDERERWKLRAHDLVALELGPLQSRRAVEDAAARDDLQRKLLDLLAVHDGLAAEVARLRERDPSRLVASALESLVAEAAADGQDSVPLDDLVRAISEVLR